MILLLIVVFISITIPSVLIGEGREEEQTAIDKVKLLMIGTRCVESHHISNIYASTTCTGPLPVLVHCLYWLTLFYGSLQSIQACSGIGTGIC